MRVSVNSVQLYSGELGQGCGNQIFDYCHTIQLVQRQSTDGADGSGPTCAGEMSAMQQLATPSLHPSTTLQSASSGESSASLGESSASSGESSASSDESSASSGQSSASLGESSASSDESSASSGESSASLGESSASLGESTASSGKSSASSDESSVIFLVEHSMYGRTICQRPK